jgi:hypothetical protein
VFTIPPHHVCLEIGHELLRRREGIVRLDATGMSMIALASLVVVPQDASPAHDVGKPVLEHVRRRCHRLVDSPHDHFGKAVAGPGDRRTLEGQLYEVQWPWPPLAARVRRWLLVTGPDLRIRPISDARRSRITAASRLLS